MERNKILESISHIRDMVSETPNDELTNDTVAQIITTIEMLVKRS